jgi:hypothetical protein
VRERREREERGREEKGRTGEGEGLIIGAPRD